MYKVTIENYEGYLWAVRRANYLQTHTKNEPELLPLGQPITVGIIFIILLFTANLLANLISIWS